MMLEEVEMLREGNIVAIRGAAEDNVKASAWAKSIVCRSLCRFHLSKV